MLSIQRISKVGPLLVEFDKWAVHEMILTPEKLWWLWEEVRRYPSLFGTLDPNHMKSFVYKMIDYDSIWFEVYDKEFFVGMLYLNNIQNVGAEFHAYFFDRKTKDKVPLCREFIRWLFSYYKFHHLSMEIPHIYHATVRLAKNIGFRHEGTRKAFELYGNKWIDKMIFGLLAEEMD